MTRETNGPHARKTSSSKPHLHSTTTGEKTPLPGTRPGPVPKVCTPQAEFVAQWYRDKGIRNRTTYTQIAKYAKVSVTVISRYFSTQPVEMSKGLDNEQLHRAVCDALRFDAKTRTRYLEELFGIPDSPAARYAVPLLDFHGTDVYALRADVDMVGNIYIDAVGQMARGVVDESSVALALGRNPKKAMQSIREKYEVLAHLPLDPVIAGTRIYVGGFLAALQEVVNPWQPSNVDGQSGTNATSRSSLQVPRGKVRSAVALQTYDELVREVFTHTGLRRFATPYFRILVREIVLMREGKEGPDADMVDDWVDKSRNLLPQLLPHVEDHRVSIAYRCQRLHTLAVRGKRQEWERELAATQSLVDELRVALPLKEELKAIVKYAEGVGHKRFMWELRGRSRTEQEREAAASANVLRELLTSAQPAPGQDKHHIVSSVHNINLYHEKLPRVHAKSELESSLIDALVWIEPEDALRRIEQLKEHADQRYPWLQSKLTAQEALALRQIGR